MANPFYTYTPVDEARQDKTRQDKTTLFNQGSPVSCKAGILRGPGVSLGALGEARQNFAKQNFPTT